MELGSLRSQSLPWFLGDSPLLWSYLGITSHHSMYEHPSSTSVEGASYKESEWRSSQILQYYDFLQCVFVSLEATSDLMLPGALALVEATCLLSPPSALKQLSALVLGRKSHSRLKGWLGKKSQPTSPCEQTPLSPPLGSLFPRTLRGLFQAFLLPHTLPSLSSLLMSSAAFWRL